MSTAALPDPRAAAGARRAAGIGVALFLLLLAAGLTWAKWWPYAHKLQGIWSSRTYPGHPLLDQAGGSGSSPSLSGAWRFTHAYILAIWQALAVALVAAAALQAFVPRDLVVRLLAGHRRTSTLAAGLIALPSMMCTCCTAPLTVSMRRSGVPAGPALAYWIGNPMLNPAVLAFTALVLPWPWVATRAIVGALLVFVATAWVGRLAGDPPARPAARLPAGADAMVPGDARAAARRFLRALLRLSVTLVPEYLVLVFGLGLLRGWAFPLGSGIGELGILAVAVAAVVGTLMVVPTGGELPVIGALRAAGLGSGVLGALLVTLPALSLPSMAMVGRALTWRVTIAMAGVVAGAGLLAALLVTLLGG